MIFAEFYVKKLINFICKSYLQSFGHSSESLYSI